MWPQRHTQSLIYPLTQVAGSLLQRPATTHRGCASQQQQNSKGGERGHEATLPQGHTPHTAAAQCRDAERYVRCSTCRETIWSPGACDEPCDSITAATLPHACVVSIYPQHTHVTPHASRASHSAKGCSPKQQQALALLHDQQQHVDQRSVPMCWHTSTKTCTPRY
jgi:hypothetical protein